MSFWLIIGLITLILGVLAFYPLLQKHTPLKTNQRDKLNKMFYFDRLKEVELDVNQGKIDDPIQSKQELQQSLLDDVPATSPPAISPSSQRTLFPILLMIVALAALLIYTQVGSWQAYSKVAATHEKLNHFYQRLQTEENNPLSEQELNEFALALRIQLQQTPQDDNGWFILGQIGMATDNGQLALDSFEKASRLQPTNLLYKLRYAQVLMFSADPKDKALAEEEIKAIIRIDHANTEALSLLAFAYFEQEEYLKAANTWEMMLKLLADDDPRRTTIERSIQSARAMVKE